MYGDDCELFTVETMELKGVNLPCFFSAVNSEKHIYLNNFHLLDPDLKMRGEMKFGESNEDQYLIQCSMGCRVLPVRFSVPRGMLLEYYLIILRNL